MAPIRKVCFTTMRMGEFKQEVLRINNKVNMEVFQQGLLSQRVDILQDKMLITAKNRRVNVLSLVDETDKSTTQIMDRALITRFKRLFIAEMKKEFGITVLAHFKDYDPELEISVSLTLFKKPVDELLPTLKSPKRT